MIQKRYTAVSAPFGDLYVTARNGLIIQIGPKKPSVTAALRQDKLPILQITADSIRRYLNGEIQSVAVFCEHRFSPFQKEVYEQIRQIPYGKSESSQKIASLIGKPHAVRAVEMLCRVNPLWIAVPCHRVLLLGENDLSDAPINAAAALRKLEKRYT